MGRDGGRGAIVVDVDCHLSGTVGGEILVEVVGVDGGDCDVLCVVEEIEGFVAAVCPPLAEIVLIQDREDAF